MPRRRASASACARMSCPPESCTNATTSPSATVAPRTSDHWEEPRLRSCASSSSSLAVGRRAAAAVRDRPAILSAGSGHGSRAVLLHGVALDGNLVCKGWHPANDGEVPRGFRKPQNRP
eukprot:scaffold29868_cov54-Phaeocystis_antarctica.AAC.1